LTDREMGNTDADELVEEVTWGLELYEVVDGWGNPLVYFVHDEYEHAFAHPPTYVLADGTRVRPRPWSSAKGPPHFMEPNGFQLFSMGEDGEPNTNDDICSWE
jgi:hypothetical protein